MDSYSSHDFNIEQKVCYSSRDLNSKLKVCYSVIQLIGETTYGLNTELFNYQTGLYHLNTKVVCYSDPHSTIPKNIKNINSQRSIF